MLFSALIIAMFLLQPASSPASENSMIGKWRTDECVITEQNGNKRTVQQGTTLQLYPNNVFTLSIPNARTLGGRYRWKDESSVVFIVPDQALMMLGLPKNGTVHRSQNRMKMQGELRSGDVIIHTMEASYTLLDDFSEKETFPAPNLEGFTVAKEWDDSTISPQWKDTHSIKYTNNKGDRIHRLEANRGGVAQAGGNAKLSPAGRKVWGWMVISGDAKNGPGDLTKNSRIIDSNCNGTFDKKYSLTEPTQIPGCAFWDAMSEPEPRREK